MRKASVLISCPDQAGIVYAVSGFLYERGLSIYLMEEHVEDKNFFTRIEWEAKERYFRNEEDFVEQFEPIRKKFDMNIKVDLGLSKKSIGLLCSREGHCLADILSRTLIGELKIEIPYIISNFEDQKKIADCCGIPFYYVSSKKGSYEHEEKMLEIIKKNKTDAIGLARYMKILSEDFINQVGQKIINVHHSFLPSFVGARPYEEAYERGVKMIGATSHYVTPNLDQGPIIDQSVQRVKHHHSIKNLKLMGRECEKAVFANAIRKHTENKIIVFKNRTIVFK